MRLRSGFAGILIMLVVVSLSACQTSQAQVSTIAGSTAGFQDGTAADAKFSSPIDLAVNSEGVIYVADTLNYRIRRISTSGSVTTLAGDGQSFSRDGSGMQAGFGGISGISISPSGTVFVMDGESEGMSTGVYLRSLSPDGTLAYLAGSSRQAFKDGLREESAFRIGANLVVDSDGIVYVADALNNRIRMVQPNGGVSTFAGSPLEGLRQGFADGPSAEARFNHPRGLAIDKNGNVYVADTGNHCIRVVSTTGWVTTLAGSGKAGFADGKGDEAQFSFPSDIAIGPDGNLYVADTANHRIRMVTPDGVVTTVAGNGKPAYVDGAPLDSSFKSPEGIWVDLKGIVYVADTGNNCIRKLVTH